MEVVEPWQIEVLPVIVHTGGVLYVTVFVHVLTHPELFVITTVYVPGDETVIQGSSV